MRRMNTRRSLSAVALVATAGFVQSVDAVPFALPRPYYFMP